MEALANPDCGWFFRRSSDDFGVIPGSPIAYWAPDALLKHFAGKAIADVADAKSGMTTTDNNRFLRLWTETSFGNIGFNYSSIDDTADGKHKWFPFAKGGEFRRWYGNFEYVVNWYDNGAEVRKAAEGATGGRLVNIDVALKKCLTWTKISSAVLSMRTKPEGIFFSDAAPGLFASEIESCFLLALANSHFACFCLSLINPTLNFVPGAIAAIPYIDERSTLPTIEELTSSNVSYVKRDWDAFETSWDFKRHPLV